MTDNILYLIGFLVLIFLQGVVINGFFNCMDEGMILEFYKKQLKKMPWWIGKPFGLCPQCMASVFGALTYWPVVLMMFGFHWQEMPVFVFDMFALVYVNFYFYKKL